MTDRRPTASTITDTQLDQLHDRLDHAEAANHRVRRLAARIRQGAPWAANFDNLADRIESALDGEQQADDHSRPWSTCTAPVDHDPHPWHDPWPLPHGQDAHCPGRPTPKPKEQP
ncbi:hypothetical protein PV383_19900 [Streptomyces caniscabiei]|uniref:Uncharacterized protein n=1 Tax=Streptomyces caniscabiei TaxID=2746961 RepID=A0ABU4MSK6_9ACTN|nr:hypothetical protein [Streptomyces caniscabiei]MBE4788439.1 hypothetical protein [Streptomyces caniscabiei]MDX2986547.1 hypothetical protein [Streptomyces caniscabiei]MDX3039424.1 hypothetical protein [Streptomyces caniscabiei]